MEPPGLLRRAMGRQRSSKGRDEVRDEAEDLAVKDVIRTSLVQTTAFMVFGTDDIVYV